MSSELHEKLYFSALPSFIFDPAQKAPDIDIVQYPDIYWPDVLSMMLRIRRTEELVGEKSAQGIVKTPVHLYIGQEAVASGLALNLKNSDFAFGNHRSHGHYLAMGGDEYSLLCEILGKTAGCSQGMGGSMHIAAPEKGFIGALPIVAGTIPIAVGAALHAKRNSRDAVAVAFFGDGAVEEGVFHEAMNFASVHSLPVFFMCENNLFSSHMYLSQRQTFMDMSRFAAVHGIDHMTIDGNDVTEVYRASRELLHISRTRRKPVFLEAVTYRWRAHVGPDTDIEIGYGRCHDLPHWKNRDPIQRLADALIKAGCISDGWLKQTDQAITENLRLLQARAEKADYPTKDKLYSKVYSET